MKYIIILGALSILLYSINKLSKIIEEFGQSKIQLILNKFTKTYISSFICGILICLITQSSTIVTIITIVLISNNLLSLEHGLCINIGSNIGTTVASLVITFDINNYYYLFFIISLLLIYIKKEFLGNILFFLGLTFLSVNIFENNMFYLFNNKLSHLLFENNSSPLKGISLGTIIAFLTQSSSATIALTQKTYMNGLISGIMGCSIMLGANIGTTISGLIFSLKESINSKRLVVSGLLFNVFGVLLVMPFLYIYKHNINTCNIKYLVSISHILFNIATGLLGLFFIKPLCYISKCLVK